MFRRLKWGRNIFCSQYAPESLWYLHASLRHRILLSWNIPSTRNCCNLVHEPLNPLSSRRKFLIIFLNDHDWSMTGQWNLDIIVAKFWRDGLCSNRSLQTVEPLNQREWSEFISYIFTSRHLLFFAWVRFENCNSNILSWECQFELWREHEMVFRSAETINGGSHLRPIKQLVTRDFRSNFQQVTTLIS